jgi:hypothetical protein
VNQIKEMRARSCKFCLGGVLCTWLIQRNTCSLKFT